MNKVLTLVFVTSLLTVSLGRAKTNNSFRANIQQKGLKSLMASIGSGELNEWPFIYGTIAATSSISTATYPGQVGLQEKVEPLLYDLAILCTQNVDSASDTIHDMSTLLKWRNLLYKYPTYGNLLLAEAVNRVLIVKLADKSLLMDRSQRELAQSLVQKARGERIPLVSWKIVVDQNIYQKNFDKIAKNALCAPEESSERCMGLWKELGRHDRLLSPEDSSCASLYDLMNKPNLPLLFHRYVITDSFFRKVEMVYKYMELEPSASIKDGFAKINKVFPEKSHRRYYITQEGLKSSVVSEPSTPDWCVEEAIINDAFYAFQVMALLRVIDSNQLNVAIPFFKNYPNMMILK